MKYVYCKSSNPFEISSFIGDVDIALVNGYKEISDEDYEKLVKHQLRWENEELVENNDASTDDGKEVGIIFGLYDLSHTKKLIDAFFDKGYRVVALSNTQLRGRDFKKLVFVFNADGYMYNYIKKIKPNTKFVGKDSRCEICNDKWKTYELLKGQDIPQPLTSLASEDITYPKLIKARRGSFGEGIFLVNNEEEEYQILSMCDPKLIMYQEYIGASKGRDICVYVLNGECIAAMKRENGSENEFRSQTIYGAEATAYELSDAEKALSIKIADTIGIPFCSINYLIDKDGTLKVCDVNSNPGLDVIQEATGVDVASKYVDYLINYVGLTSEDKINVAR